HKAYERLKII
ncbi:hypothetical protein CP09DC80_1023B, partial [Chlamydia psittaci 09DC80]